MRFDAWSPMDGRPAAQGMYDPRNEHDACGVGFVATLTGVPGHEMVEQALTVLRNLEHRGATGSEPDSGDGAGILLQIPDAFLQATLRLEFFQQNGGFFAFAIDQVLKSDNGVFEFLPLAFPVAGFRSVGCIHRVGGVHLQRGYHPRDVLYSCRLICKSRLEDGVFNKPISPPPRSRVPFPCLWEFVTIPG